MSHYLSQTHYSLFFVSLMHTHSHSLSHYLRTSVQLFYLSSVVVVDFLDLTYLSPFFKTLLSSNIIPSIVLTISYYLSHYHVLTLSLPFTIFLTITSYLSYCLSHFFSLYLTHIHFLSHIICNSFIHSANL
jgi:hypothetical protein